MNDDSDQFRKRALKCRKLAMEARNQESRDELTEMARQLEDAADEIDGLGGDTPTSDID